ncbi:unnamed protein product [Commensalibacter communis]|nr:unnamed protein product [Commensalibacter communis]
MRNAKQKKYNKNTKSVFVLSLRLYLLFYK